MEKRGTFPEAELRSVTVADVLLARDERAQRQAQFLKRHGLPLVSFTLNIPGPVKNSPLILRTFEEGILRIEAFLQKNAVPIAECFRKNAFTGPEALWAVDWDANALKREMCLLEEADELGRLFDMDVIAANGEHLSRPTERKCLLCSKPVRACARSRAHTADELFARAEAIMHAFFENRAESSFPACTRNGFSDQTDEKDGDFLKKIAEYAFRALVCEVAVGPKPGLVDPFSNGAHTDMDIITFLKSAHALRPYFERCARLGAENTALPVQELFRRLQTMGLHAEKTMLEATGGVNTHKGAIFALGILTCAAGICGKGAARDEVLSRAAQLGQCSLAHLLALRGDPERHAENAEGTGSASLSPIGSEAHGLIHGLTGGEAHGPIHGLTGGEAQFLLYGLTGARGEAASGFRTAKKISLPALENALENGQDLHDAALFAFVHLMAIVEDSNILRRRGRKALDFVHARARALLETFAAYKTPETNTVHRTSETGVMRSALADLDVLFTCENISPGGSADLLAVTLFLHFLKNGTAADNLTAKFCPDAV